MNITQNDILQKKIQKNAVIAAHLYQPLKIQLIADFVGDSFELAKKCASSDAERIIFCGVHFMGESAKILSKQKRVFVPAPDARCGMAAMITGEDVKKLKEQNPGAAVVCYINSTAEVKAQSDICCTSSNALKAVLSLKEDKIIFVPDKNLGRYIAAQVPEKQFVFYDGYCPVHNALDAETINAIKKSHPSAPVLMHPECTEEASSTADFIGSTSQIIAEVGKRDDAEFIIATEEGVVERLIMLYPGKRFYLAGSSLHCPDMKKCTFENIYRSLEEETGEILYDSETMARAERCLKRMMKL